MAYSSGLLDMRVSILRRVAAEGSDYGTDGTGVSWYVAGTTWANVTFTRGVRAMAAGALDAYACVTVRMRYNSKLDARCRLLCDGTTYQILPETFHADRRANIMQMQAQAVVDAPEPVTLAE